MTEIILKNFWEIEYTYFFLFQVPEKKVESVLFQTMLWPWQETVQFNLVSEISSSQIEILFTSIDKVAVEHEPILGPRYAEFFYDIVQVLEATVQVAHDDDACKWRFGFLQIAWHYIRTGLEKKIKD